MNIINRFLSWRAYRRKLAIRYRIATGKPKASITLLCSDTVETIIKQYKLIYNHTPEKRFKDEWDELIEDIDD